MLKDMFTVFDAAAKTFCIPFFSENISTAMRAFQYAANDPQSEISKYPADYTLFHFGTFDHSTCEITTITPAALANALTLVIKPEVNTDV
ncbi:MAG: nonstructural protein [Microvirus sp.]|nr:MAG: nonstructural protein [Microvirus sp.]